MIGRVSKYIFADILSYRMSFKEFIEILPKLSKNGFNAYIHEEELMEYFIAEPDLLSSAIYKIVDYYKSIYIVDGLELIKSEEFDKYSAHFIDKNNIKEGVYIETCVKYGNDFITKGFYNEGKLHKEKIVEQGIDYKCLDVKSYISGEKIGSSYKLLKCEYGKGIIYAKIESQESGVKHTVKYYYKQRKNYQRENIVTENGKIEYKKVTYFDNNKINQVSEEFNLNGFDFTFKRLIHDDYYIETHYYFFDKFEMTRVYDNNHNLIESDDKYNYGHYKVKECFKNDQYYTKIYTDFEINEEGIKLSDYLELPIREEFKNDSITKDVYEKQEIIYQEQDNKTIKRYLSAGGNYFVDKMQIENGQILTAELYWSNNDEYEEEILIETVYFNNEEIDRLEIYPVNFDGDESDY